MDMSNIRYMVVLGPNTKQWWVYDEEKDEYIDPPEEVLKEIKKHSGDITEQEKFFNSILAEEPEWLNDVGFRYDDVEI